MSSPAGKEPPEDPSMEDILASIRRILNDDEAPTTAVPGEPASAAPAEDVFLLDQTMLIEMPHTAQAAPTPIAPEPEIEIAPDMRYAPEPARPAVETAPPPPAALAEPYTDAPLLAPSAAAAATASLGALVRVVGQQQTPVYRGGGVTLEDMVRDEIRPLVKTWLDENLAPMVEKLVRAEIARVTGNK